MPRLAQFKKRHCPDAKPVEMSLARVTVTEKTSLIGCSWHDIQLGLKRFIECQTVLEMQ
jgi:hypothetical protein